LFESDSWALCRTLLSRMLVRADSRFVARERMRQRRAGWHSEVGNKRNKDEKAHRNHHQHPSWRCPVCREGPQNVVLLLLASIEPLASTLYVPAFSVMAFLASSASPSGRRRQADNTCRRTKDPKSPGRTSFNSCENSIDRRRAGQACKHSSVRSNLPVHPAH
jgi:hypothetical protein